MGDDTQKRFELLRSVGEECVLESELRNLVEKKPGFRLYDGFEPSGRMHIAQGIFKAMNVNKCTRAGGEFTFWVADWFALMNDKMGGDLVKIKDVGQYFVNVWKAAGMDMNHVHFRWCSDEITQNADKYWPQCLDIARVFSVARIKKCCTIMGRKENSLTAAQILYPTMQCTDVFFLKADICQLGVDQRKVNMLAREYCDAVGIKLKPIILSHHMLYGLKEGQAKMSKSDPDSAIFMEDTAEDVVRKIKQAYCPARPKDDRPQADNEIRLVVDELENPCLDYVKNIIFSAPEAVFKAGGAEYRNYHDVEAAFVDGSLGEEALKDALAKKVNELLEPVRQHFQNDPEAKALLERIKTYKKETLVLEKTTDANLRRLKAMDGSTPIHAVFAPVVSGDWKLSTVISLIYQLQAAQAGHKAVLWLPDWSSIAANSLNGDHKSIKASYQLLVCALKAVRPQLIDNVSVMYQSDAILKDPSNYWISVINVGRTYSVQHVMDAYGSEDLTAGQVVFALMHVGDVLALAPTTIGTDSTLKPFTDLAVDYYSQVALSVDVDLRLKSLDADEHMGPEELYVLDAVHDISAKLKKAFCEPQNTTFCPPLALAKQVVIPMAGTLTIKRKEENGGDKVYTEVDELYADFASMSLHPGDLKPAIKDSIEAVLAPIHEVLKTDAACKKAAADVKAAMKKAAKKK